MGGQVFGRDFGAVSDRRLPPCLLAGWDVGSVVKESGSHHFPEFPSFLGSPWPHHYWHIGCPLTSPLVPTAQDSVILDFEWFANTSDYGFGDSGESWYEDFGWNPQLFSAPTQQLKKYLEDRSCANLLVLFQVLAVRSG